MVFQLVFVDMVSCFISCFQVYLKTVSNGRDDDVSCVIGKIATYKWSLSPGLLIYSVYFAYVFKDVQ